MSQESITSVSSENIEEYGARNYQLFLRGIEGRNLLIKSNDSVTLSGDTKVKTLRTMVTSLLGIPVDDQLLYFASRPLTDYDEKGNSRKLSNFGIKNLSTIVLALRLRGGSSPNSLS